MRVLIIDDDIGDAKLAAAKLNDSPIFKQVGSVFGHEYGKSRLDFYSKADADIRPNVIIIEAKLNGGSSVELIRLAKKSSLKAIPIVIYTGTDDEEVKRSCLAAGAMKIIAKGPRGPEELAAFVTALAPKTI